MKKRRTIHVAVSAELHRRIDDFRKKIPSEERVKLSTAVRMLILRGLPNG
jgi:hypothetical protein